MTHPLWHGHILTAHIVVSLLTQQVQHVIDGVLQVLCSRESWAKLVHKNGQRFVRLAGMFRTEHMLYDSVNIGSDGGDLRLEVSDKQSVWLASFTAKQMRTRYSLVGVLNQNEPKCTSKQNYFHFVSVRLAETEPMSASIDAASIIYVWLYIQSKTCIDIKVLDLVHEIVYGQA